MSQIYSQNSTIAVLFLPFVFVLFFFFFFMSWLCLVLKRSIITPNHSYRFQKKNVFSPKLRERRLLRLDLGHNKNQWGAQSLSREGRCWGPDGKSRTFRSRSPRCQLRTSALRTRTHTPSHVYPGHTHARTHARQTADTYPKYESSSYWSM